VEAVRSPRPLADQLHPVVAEQLSDRASGESEPHRRQLLLPRGDAGDRERVPGVALCRQPGRRAAAGRSEPRTSTTVSPWLSRKQGPRVRTQPVLSVPNRPLPLAPPSRPTYAAPRCARLVRWRTRARRVRGQGHRQAGQRASSCARRPDRDPSNLLLAGATITSSGAQARVGPVQAPMRDALNR